MFEHLCAYPVALNFLTAMKVGRIHMLKLSLKKILSYLPYLSIFLQSPAVPVDKNLSPPPPRKPAR